MSNFITTKNNTLRLDLEGTGITFLYIRGQGHPGDTLHVPQSWPSIHALLSRLRRDGEYATWDKALFVRLRDQELSLRFRTRDNKLYEECRFSPDETAKIMDFLERAPNLN